MRHTLEHGEHPFMHAISSKPTDERKAFGRKVRALAVRLTTAFALTEATVESETILIRADIALEMAFIRAATGPGCACQAADWYYEQKKKLVGVAAGLWGGNQRIVVMTRRPR